MTSRSVNKLNQVGSSEEPNEGELKTQKKHTTFKVKTHQGTKFLKTYIVPAPQDKTRFNCKLCKERYNKNYSGFCENLKVHLQNNSSHLKTLATDKLIKDNQNAIRYLEKQKESISPSRIMEEEEEEDAEKEADTNIKKSRIKDQNIPNSVLLKFEVARFIITHNLPFSFGKSLVEFIQYIANRFDLLTIEDTSVYNKQISHIAKNCVASTIKERYLSLLETSPFSLSIDEGTDKSGKSYLALSVRCFLESNNNEPEEKFLCLIKLEDSSTGEVLYDKINEILFHGIKADILKSNFIGICSDHGSNMLSNKIGYQKLTESKKGVLNRFKVDFPHCFVIHDYAHAFNIIIEEGVSKFPAHIISIVNKICAHFSRSPQNRVKFRKIQLKQAPQKQPLEILRYIEIRWSSLKTCLDRIIELACPLKEYFNKHGTPSQQDYLNEENLLYFKLISALLGKINTYIMFFQEDNISTNVIIKTLKEAFVLIGELTVKIPESLDTEISYKAQEDKFNLI